MTAQTAEAVRALRSCGLVRGDFSVRTPRRRDGEYAATRVCLFIKAEEAVRLVPKFAAAGFYVTRYLLNDGEELRPLLHWQRPLYWQRGDERVDVLRLDFNYGGRNESLPHP